MRSLAQEEYLTAEVLGASPQKLQFLVLDVALRECLRARSLLEAQQRAAARRALQRSEEAISMLLANMNYDDKSPVVAQAAGVYLFVYKSLLAAQVSHDLNKLGEAIRVLEIERETWRLASERHSATRLESAELTPPAPLSGARTLLGGLHDHDALARGGNFSFEV